MGAATGTTTQFTVSLTEEERSLLLDWLEQQLKAKLVEEHRTDALDFRVLVLQQETAIQKLIDTLRKR
jgi:hypothetical protein